MADPPETPETPAACTAYEDALNLEQEASLRYVTPAQRLGDHGAAGCERAWTPLPGDGIELSAMGD